MRREVRADLDEARAELGIKDVEEVDADPALGLVPVEPHADGGARLLRRREHPLELLGDDDGDDPGSALPLRSLEMRADVVKLAVVPESSELEGGVPLSSCSHVTLRLLAGDKPVIELR